MEFIFYALIFIVIAIFSFRKLKGISKVKELETLKRVNEENSTNFKPEYRLKYHALYFDPTTNKIFFNNVSGMKGVKDYSIIRRWQVEEEPDGKVITAKIIIYTRDYENPSLTLPYTIMGFAQSDFAKIGAFLG